MATIKVSDSLLADASGDPLISHAQANIPLCTDALDGATPTVDQLETAVGVLGGKINAIIAVLEAHGLAKAS